MKHFTTIGVCFALMLTWAASTTPAQEGEKPARKDKLPYDGLKALTHPNPVVRYNSAALLGRLGPVAKFAIPALHEALRDKDVSVRVKVAEALWKIEHPPAKLLLPVLARALRDKEAAAR